MSKIIRRKFAIAIEMAPYIVFPGLACAAIGYVIPNMFIGCIDVPANVVPCAIIGGAIGSVGAALWVLVLYEKGEWSEKDDDQK